MNRKKNKFEKDQVKQLAKRYGYDSVQCTKESNFKMTFKKERVKGCGGTKEEYGPARVDVFFTTGAVRTYLDHPKAGKGQMHR